MRSGSLTLAAACLFGIVPLLLLSGSSARGGSNAPRAPEPSCLWNRFPNTDTLSVIWKPLATLPALVRPGDTLSVWAHAPADPAHWSARLRLEARTFLLTPAEGEYRQDLRWWILGFVTPPNLPEEVYDLILESDTGAADTTRHSVKLLPRFRQDYYFAQVTDTHLPAEEFSSNSGWSPCDTTGMADFGTVIDDLNLIHPEFILHTGDLVNEGDLESLYGMYEMGRARRMISRLRDPLFLVSGNHDIGGWNQTPVPAGTARQEWWRNFGWPWLGDPPPGAPYRSQLYSFDYGNLHCAGMEAYNNYDDYLPGTYGSDSFTAEELAWLQHDLASAGGKHKLLFYHYDFRSQIRPASLGVEGAIWGHVHPVAEGNLNARPFNLGCQSVSHGRTFRIFRVHDGSITPGPMHHSGAAGDSLSAQWSGPNDGSQHGLSVRVTNGFKETWDHARLLFRMAGPDSSYLAEGGVIAQTVPMDGAVNVYVDCPLPAAGTTTITVRPSGPTLPDGGPASAEPWLGRPGPSPFPAGAGPMTIWYWLPVPGLVDVSIFDAGGRQVARLFHAEAAAGSHPLDWNGRTSGGSPAPSGIYLIRLQSGGTARARRVVILR